MTFVEVKFECINWWGNEVYRTKNGTPILRLPEDGWFSIADPSDIDGEYFDVPIGEPFYYETYDIVSNNKATFKLVKTPNKHKSCNYCPLIKHFCGGIECYCIAKKVY